MIVDWFRSHYFREQMALVSASALLIALAPRRALLRQWRRRVNSQWLARRCVHDTSNATTISPRRPLGACPALAQTHLLEPAKLLATAAGRVCWRGALWGFGGAEQG